MDTRTNFWKEFWSLLRPYWTSKEKWQALALLVSIVIFSLIQVRLLVFFNDWYKVFYDMLQAFNTRGILQAFLKFSIFATIFILVATYNNYFTGLLANRWRRWLTNFYMDKWLENKVFYGLQILNKRMDNPDQRISEDLNELPQMTLALFLGLFHSILILLSFSTILWKLSGTLIIPLGQQIKVHIHGYMFWATVLYASLGTWITIKLGKNLIQLNYQQEKYNANFRFSLIRIRESAEQIALYQGEHDERQKLSHSFTFVFSNFIELLRLQKILNLFVNGYNQIQIIAAILIALPRYIAERLPIGHLMQVNNAFQQVVTAFSFVVNSYSLIANWRAVIRRLIEFNYLMDEASSEMTQRKIHIQYTEQPHLSIINLTLALPDGTVLLEPLHFQIKSGQHILINGPSGTGKSTLLRAIAGLWPYGEGVIVIPKNIKKLFLPQKPYLPLGSLKHVLLYPKNYLDSRDVHGVNEPQIAINDTENVLRDCGLLHLIDKLDEVHNWATEFSLGEQQLIAFARIFILKPDWIFLDEATSALDEVMEMKMYQLLHQRLPHATIISIGHRSSLQSFHQEKITLEKRRLLV